MLRRTSKVTLQVLNDYKDMLQDAKHDLQDHLRDISSRLDSALAPRGHELSTGVMPDLERMQFEKESTERCLEICSQFLSHINTTHFQLASTRPSSQENMPVAISVQELTLSDTMTLSTLKACSTKLLDNMMELRTQRDAVEERLQTNPTTAHGDQEADPQVNLQRLRGELDSTTERLAVCERAAAWVTSGQVHVVEDIEVGDGSQQLCVSTLGDLFKIKGARAGHGSLQFIGSTTEATLLKIIEASSRQEPSRGNDSTTDETPCTSSVGGSRAM